MKEKKQLLWEFPAGGATVKYAALSLPVGGDI